MAFRTTPQLGPQIDEVFTSMPYWDMGGNLVNGNVTGLTEPSYKLGNRETGSDGHVYIWVRAASAIAALASPGREVAITEPAFTAATGTGGFYAPPGVAIPAGAYFHARKGLPVNP